MKIKITKSANWYKVGEEYDVDIKTIYYIGTQFLVKNWLDVYEQLHGKLPKDNEEEHLEGMAISLKHAETIDATADEIDILNNAWHPVTSKFFD